MILHYVSVSFSMVIESVVTVSGLRGKKHNRGVQQLEYQKFVLILVEHVLHVLIQLSAFALGGKEIIFLVIVNGLQEEGQGVGVEQMVSRRLVVLLVGNAAEHVDTKKLTNKFKMKQSSI